jgi:hypothetical protein
MVSRRPYTMQALSGIRTGILSYDNYVFCQLDTISDLWIIEPKDAPDMPDDTSHAANKHEKEQEEIPPAEPTQSSEVAK